MVLKSCLAVLINPPYNIRIDDTNIIEVNSTKFLVVIIYKKLTWQQHITNIASKISKAIGVIERVRYKLPRSSLLSLYYSPIYPHLCYCNIVWGSISKSSINELITLQKRAIRIITNSNYICHTDPLFKTCKILKFGNLNYYFSCQFSYINIFLVYCLVCVFSFLMLKISHLTLTLLEYLLSFLFLHFVHL